MMRSNCSAYPSYQEKSSNAFSCILCPNACVPKLELYNWSTRNKALSIMSVCGFCLNLRFNFIAILLSSEIVS